MASRFISFVLLAVLLTACASKPGKDALLPDEGPTTKEVYDNHVMGGGVSKNDTTTTTALEQPWNSTIGRRVLPAQSEPSSLAERELDALKRDFRQVPNPEVLGYVYPHMAGSAPIPGYFTMFKLYSSDHYAVSYGEGINITTRSLP